MLLLHNLCSPDFMLPLLFNALAIAYETLVY